MTNVGDFVAFDEMPDIYPFGIEGKVIDTEFNIVVLLEGTGEILHFSDLWGSWDSSGRFKLELFSYDQ